MKFIKITFLLLLLTYGCAAPDASATIEVGPVAETTATSLPTPTPQEPVEVVWILEGGEIPFSSPMDVAISEGGYVYIADGLNNLIHKFDLNGNFVSSWGGEGGEEGKFDFILPGNDTKGGIAVDRNGDVYVADNQNRRVQKFSPDGSFLMVIGARGAEDGQFLSPFGVAVAPNGNIYVIDDVRDDMQVFDADGDFLFKWGGHGKLDGQFYNVGDFAIGEDGKVYVADYQNQRIQIFDSEGNFITKWGSLGDGDYEFESPDDVALDSQGNIYISNQAHHAYTLPRIQVFDNDGVYLMRWGSFGSEPGQFNLPRGVAIDQAGNVYVVDTENNRVQKFSVILIN